MMWYLIRRDWAWQGALMLIPVGLLVPLIPHDEAEIVRDIFYMMILGAFIFVDPARRATAFEAALPIDARDLLAARLIALLSLVWLPLLAASVSTVLIIGAGGWERAGPLIVNACFASVAILLIHSMRNQEMRAPKWTLVAIGIPASSLYLSAVAPALPLGSASILICALLLYRIWSKVPPSFQCAPVESVAPRAKGSWRMAPAFGSWPLIRSSFSLASLGFAPMLVMFGWQVGWFFWPIFAGFGYAEARQRTRWALALPVARQKLLLVCMIPALPLMLALIVPHPFSNSKWEFVRFGGPGESRVQVALALWRVAPHGQAPAVTSPWGESHRPAVRHLAWIPIYNPYEASQRDGERFFEWQFGRATEAAYGRTIASGDFSKVMDVDPRPVTSQPRMWLLTGSALMVSFLFWAWLAEAAQWRALVLLPRRLNLALKCCAAFVPMLVVTVSSFVNPTHNDGLLFSELPQAGLYYLARALPSFGLVIVAFAPVILGWFAVLRQSRFAEITRAQRCLP